MPPCAAMRVRTPGRVVEREHLDLVAELAERGRGARAGEARADDEHVELPLVRRVDELDLELVVVPLLGDRTVGDVGVERDLAHDTTPVTTMSGKLTLAMPMISANADRELPPRVVPLRVVEPEALEHRPGAVEDVDRQRDVGDDVDDRDRHPLEAVDHVRRRRRRARSPGSPVPQVRSMRWKITKRPTMTPVQRIVRDAKFGGDVVARRLVLRRPGPLVHPGELRGADDVEEERRDQADAQDPQEHGPGSERLAEGAEPLGVLVEVRGAQVDLEVADHVEQDEAQEHDPGDGHDPLLADRGAPEAQDRVPGRAGRVDRRRSLLRRRLRGCHDRVLIACSRLLDPPLGCAAATYRFGVLAHDPGPPRLSGR